MLYQYLENLNDLKEKYQESLKNFVLEDSISSYTDLSNFLFKYTFKEINFKNLNNFLTRSNPELIFSDDLVSVEVNGVNVGEISFGEIKNLTYQNLMDMFPTKDNEIKFKIEVVEKSQARYDFEEQMPTLVKEYCDFWNKKIQEILGEKVGDKIYHVYCGSNEMEVVFNKEDQVAYGNTWDFHPGCNGLTVYKKVKLGNWKGAGSLASILSNGLNKKVKYVNVDKDKFGILTQYHTMTVK